MKVAVTGATSDFAAAILPRLLADPDIESVVGIGRRDLTLQHPKLTYVRRDIRATDLEDIFAGCDTVMHLAFVVEEIRDKSQTHDINIRGSRNVIDSAYRAGARRVVVASSINAYGPELRSEPVDEDVYPEGDPVRYYFHDKAEVEHYAEWWLRRHPDEMTISLLRPAYIIGPDFSNDGIDQLTGPVGVFPQVDKAAYQFLHQDDMADAFHRAAKQDLVGPFNVGPDGWTGVQELAAMQGQRLFQVPEGPAIVAANLAFRVGLTKFSGQWVTAGETVVDSTLLKKATGWEPALNSREAAAVMILLQGKALMRSCDALTRTAACEAALEPATTSTRADISRLQHVQLDIETGCVHAEVHPAHTSSHGSLVIPMPPGTHARYYTDLANEVAESGIDVILVDLPGHGLSTGKRGSASDISVVEAVAAATAYARSTFGSQPVVAQFRELPPVGAPRVGSSSAGLSILGSAIGRARRIVTGESANPSATASDKLIPARVNARIPAGVADHRVDGADEIVSLFGTRSLHH